MPINMNTHGHDWKRVCRDHDIFCALVTPAWHLDRFAQRQYAYARQLGKPIVLLVQAGAPLPPDADEHVWRVWETTEELAALVKKLTSSPP